MNDRSRRTLLAGALAGLLLGTTACVAPTTDAGDVRHQANLSAAAAVSELATVEMVTRTQLAGRLYWTSTDVVVTASEQAVSSVEQTFTSRQPPRTSDPLWTRTGDLLSQAAGAVTDVRVAVRRHDTRELQRLLHNLAPLQRRLDRLESRTA